MTGTAHVSVEARWFPHCDQCGAIGFATGYVAAEVARAVAEEHRIGHEDGEGEEE